MFYNIGPELLSAQNFSTPTTESLNNKTFLL